MTGDVEAALGAAVRARRAYRSVPAHVRQVATRHVAARIADEAETLATLIVSEGVKTIREARAEVARAERTFLIAAEEAVRLTGGTIAFDRTADADDRWGHWTPRPIGVVVGITPYNDPLNLVAHKIAPAIACGAPIIVKPHEATPTPARMIARYVAETDLPDGAVQLIEGGPDVVRALVSDDRVCLVSFTGGATAGRSVAEAAGLKKLAMELGGIGASYIHEDADMDQAAKRLASGIVWAAGQNCVHTQHVVAHEVIAAELADRLVSRLSAMVCGDRMHDATDIGRQVHIAAAHRINTLIDDAVSAGARELVRVRADDPQIVGPCLLTDVPPDHPIAREEIFGPVAVLTVVKGIEHAIDRVTALGPAINTSIFSDSMAAILRWDDAIDAGATVVNDSTDFRVDHMPFGGNGAAGIGREGVRSAMEAMTEKHVTVFAQ